MQRGMGTGNVAVVRLVQSVNNQAEKCATKLLKSAKWYGMQLICKAMEERILSLFCLMQPLITPLTKQSKGVIMSQTAKGG